MSVTSYAPLLPSSSIRPLKSNWRRYPSTHMPPRTSQMEKTCLCPPPRTEQRKLPPSGPLQLALSLHIPPINRQQPLGNVPSNHAPGYDQLGLRLKPVGQYCPAVRTPPGTPLKHYRTLAYMWEGHIGTVRATKHYIELITDKKPILNPPYRAGPPQRELQKAKIDSMLAKDVIEAADSEWAAHIGLCGKKDSTLRFCVEYLHLNS